MDFKKAYEDALERAKDIYNGNPSSLTAKVVCGQIFPEIKESEDERIGNLIYCIVRDREDVRDTLEANGISMDKALAYLERRKEQKPAGWSGEDDAALDYLHELIGFGFTKNFFDAQTAADMRKWVNKRLKAIQPNGSPARSR